MLTDVLGIMSAPAVAAWERVPAGLLLTAIYLLGLAFLAFKSRDQLADLRQSWWQTALLALLGLFSSTLLPLAFTAGENLLPLNSALSYESIITLFAFIPLLLAAALLNLPAALLVGLATGTGRMLWISHSLVDPFFLALTGAVLGWALRQRYDHVAYGLLRRPIVSAPLLALPLSARLPLQAPLALHGEGVATLGVLPLEDVDGGVLEARRERHDALVEVVDIAGHRGVSR